MAPEERKLKTLYHIHQEEGALEAIRSIQRHLRNKVPSRREPLGYLINKARPSTSIWERDWDICCILDGCRYDTFEEVYDGRSDRIRSVASTSPTWISRTFESTGASNVAYISANPWSDRVDTERFGYFHLESTQETQYGIETVPPENLADRTIDVWRDREQHDLDTIVVHFMQPHVPFRNFPSLFEEFQGTTTWGSKVWGRIDSGDISREQFFEAYRDNLEWVLEDGVKLIKENCDATIAVTADHGNAAGEWGYYGHPKHSPVSSVRVVPWAMVEGSDRGIRTPDVGHKQEETDIDEQLRELGYN